MKKGEESFCNGGLWRSGTRGQGRGFKRARGYTRLKIKVRGRKGKRWDGREERSEKLLRRGCEELVVGCSGVVIAGVSCEGIISEAEDEEGRGISREGGEENS